MSDLYENAALFDGGARRLKGVNAKVEGNRLTIHNVVNDAVMISYTITDTAKNDGATGAFDAFEDGVEGERKIVVQLGCGCSGMRPWTPDQTYIDRQNAKIEALRAARGY